MSENLLGSETSPYLLQHKDNPVHWQPWNGEALDRARDQNKPILLSIGYAACHWCHVMAHESFENPATADLMNELFINIKIDREERPDLDSIYQSALNLMGEQGGWPLTMFLDPEGKPFWGGTYFPPTSGYGRPAFRDVLHQISHAYKHEIDKININTERLTTALKKHQSQNTGATLTTQKISNAAQTALGMIDFQYGGTHGAPKFPQPVFQKFLWLEYIRTGEQKFCDATTITLDNICQGGIYDHIGGGFSRYSVDEIWLVPHFEKMLYDNALILELLSDVWKTTKSPIYQQRVFETIGWMLDDLRIHHGDLFGLASARDADSEGVEGKFYVWSKDEIENVLGADSEFFCQIYSISEHGNWEGSNIAHRQTDEKELSKTELSLLENCRNKLLAVRNNRIAPMRDDKILADWNALAVSALVQCSHVFEEPAWLEAAQIIYDFIKNHMMKNDRINHSWCDGQLRHNATLDDYANLSRAALSLHQATADPGYLIDAKSWVEAANTWYWDDDDGGYFLSASDTHDVFIRNKVIFDNATPSGNGIMLDALARLFVITGEENYRMRAQNLIDAICPAEPNGILNQPSLAIGYEILSSCAQVVIALPDNKDPIGNPLVQAAQKAAPLHFTVSVIYPDQILRDSHPAFGKNTLDGHAAAYICRNQSCELPITNPDELTDSLFNYG